MHNFFNRLVIFVIAISFSSCYTLTLHQTGKTVGKGNLTVQLTGGLAGLPQLEQDDNNYKIEGFYGPAIQVYQGISNKFDLGLNIGINKFGGAFKYQWIGDQDSKAAISSGANLFIGLKDWSSIFDGESIVGIEVPLFISYHFNENFAVFSHPTLSYYEVKDELNLFEDPFHETGFYKGLVTGIQIGPLENKNGNKRFFPTLEISWSAPLYDNKYYLSTTFGIGYKF